LAKQSEEEVLVGTDRANAGSLTNDDLGGSNAPSAPPTATSNRPPTNTVASNMPASEVPLDPVAAAQKKEEDEFLKLESIFISELGIDSTQFQQFVAK
jgi:hypothetical protein